MTRAYIPAIKSSLQQATQRVIVLISIAVALLCTGASATAAGFNCAKAKTGTEKLICSDRELGELDTRLATVYAKTQSSSGDFDATVAAERHWIKTVRDKCGTIDCLKGAYRVRIKQLARAFVSFDCEQAKTKVEVLICADDGLQQGDMQLAQTYRALKGVSAQQKVLVADQTRWLDEVRDRCEDVTCLQSTVSQRTDALRQQWTDRLESTRKKIGYTKHSFYSDMMLWPNDPRRTILVFATQASARQDIDSNAQQDEDFEIDLYVIDSTSHKILQHGTDSVSSDAIALSGLSLDTSNFATRLGAPVFGIATSHWHYGCAGYSSSSIRLYTATGKEIKVILSDIALASSGGMCQTDCEYQSSQRDLQFTGPAGQRYPSLVIHELRKEAESDPKGPADNCKTKITKKEYKLQFDGVQYPVPQGLDY